MESNYQASMLALKSSALFRFLSNVSSLRKCLIFLSAVFFPWAMIYRLKCQLKKITEEGLRSSHSESVNLFKHDRNFTLLQPSTAITNLSRDKIAGMLHWPE